jgi:predicted Zn-dependent protease
MQSTEQAAGEDLMCAKQELQRAYLLLGYGDTAAALLACERARRAAPSHPMPTLLEGSIQIAAGDLRGALATLKRATQRWPAEPLGHLYLAEANLLLGRRDAGLKALAQASALDSALEHRQLISELDTIFQSLDPQQLPPPVKIVSQQGEE